MVASGPRSTQAAARFAWARCYPFGASHFGYAMDTRCAKRSSCSRSALTGRPANFVHSLHVAELAWSATARSVRAAAATPR
eukprot:7682789-Pyramimonas_sp.AAC.1